MRGESVSWEKHERTKTTCICRRVSYGLDFLVGLNSDVWLWTCGACKLSSLLDRICVWWCGPSQAQDFSSWSSIAAAAAFNCCMIVDFPWLTQAPISWRQHYLEMNAIIKNELCVAYVLICLYLFTTSTPKQSYICVSSFCLILICTLRFWKMYVNIMNFNEITDLLDYVSKKLIGSHSQSQHWSL